MNELMYKSGKQIVIDKLTNAIINEDLRPSEGRLICHIAYLMSATSEDETLFEEIYKYFKEIDYGE